MPLTSTSERLNEDDYLAQVLENVFLIDSALILSGCRDPMEGQQASRERLDGSPPQRSILPSISPPCNPILTSAIHGQAWTLAQIPRLPRQAPGENTPDEEPDSPTRGQQIGRLETLKESEEMGPVR